jgi:hypothetical protein
MANTDKNIIIVPNTGQTDDPTIIFSGANSSVGPQSISLNVLPDSNGTLSFESTSGQLFSITNDLTGTIFSVNDISGIPSLEIDSDGTVRIAEFSGNVLVGTSNDNNTDKLQVDGDISANNIKITGALSADGSIGTSGQTLRSDGTKSFWSTEVGFTGSQGDTGFTGSQGNVGFTGSQGNIGFTGSQGVQGNIGFTGSQGIQGVVGFTGSQGVTGFTGSQGIQGVVGFTGSQGVVGFTGSQGVQGNVGFTGSQGVVGFTGSQGVTGFTGSQGDIGFTGSQGNIGFTGSQGEAGQAFINADGGTPSSIYGGINPIDGGNV